jgi:hypothetical protein
VLPSSPSVVFVFFFRCGLIFCHPIPLENREKTGRKEKNEKIKNRAQKRKKKEENDVSPSRLSSPRHPFQGKKISCQRSCFGSNSQLSSKSMRGTSLSFFQSSEKKTHAHLHANGAQTLLIRLTEREIKRVPRKKRETKESFKRE